MATQGLSLSPADFVIFQGVRVSLFNDNIHTIQIEHPLVRTNASCFPKQPAKTRPIVQKTGKFSFDVGACADRQQDDS